MTHTVHMDPVNVMADALRRAGAMMTSDSRDWGKDRSDVWLYGLLVGWECEERHEHDDECGGDGALLEVAARHGWDADDIARLRRYRAAIAEVTSRPGGIITVDKQLTDAELAERWKVSMQYVTNVQTIANSDIVGDARRRAAEIKANPTTVYKVGEYEVSWNEYQDYAADPAPRRRWWQRRNR